MLLLFLMGCRKLTYQNFETPLKVVYRKPIVNKKGVQSCLSVDPLAHLREWVSPYNYCQNNPINRIDPDGAFDTNYKDEEGNLVMKTDDGKTDDVTISDEHIEDFKKMAELQAEDEGLHEIFNASGFNNFWRGKFGASTDVGEEQKEGIEIVKEMWNEWTDEQGALEDYLANPSFGTFVNVFEKRGRNQFSNLLNYMPSTPSIKVKRNFKPKASFKDIRKTAKFPKGHFKGRGSGYANKANGAIYRMSKTRRARANEKINKAANKAENFSNGIIVAVPKPQNE